LDIINHVNKNTLYFVTGVSAMDMTTMAVKSRARPSGITASRSASVSTTKANSPPPERSKPVRTHSPQLKRKTRPSAVIITALNATKPNNSATTYETHTHMFGATVVTHLYNITSALENNLM